MWLLTIIRVDISVIFRDNQLPKYSKEKNNKIPKSENKEIEKKFPKTIENIRNT